MEDGGFSDSRIRLIDELRVGMILGVTEDNDLEELFSGSHVKCLEGYVCK